MFTPQAFQRQSTSARIDALARCGESEAFAADPTLERPASPELLRVLRQDEVTVVGPGDVHGEADDTITRELVMGRLFETGSDPCIVCASPLGRPSPELRDLAVGSLMLDTVPDAFVPRPFDSFSDTIAAPLRRPIPHVFAMAHRPRQAPPPAPLGRVIGTTFAVLTAFALLCAALHAVIQGTLTLASIVVR